LKHNQVLHERIIIVCVRSAPEPRIADRNIATMEQLSHDIDRVTLTYGFMQSPNVTRGLTLARAKGLQFDPVKTSFFVSRRSLSPKPGGAMPRWQDLLYVFLARNATNASAFFHIPAARTVELGAQLSI